MSALTFTLRAPPEQRLDLSPLTPDGLAGKSLAEIERIELQTTRQRACVGDVFRVSGGDAASLRFAGGAERFDRVGFGMSGGELLVEGEVGAEAGRAMRGGALTIRGRAGPYAASALAGGALTILGDAGERLGGPLAGETVGMHGGLVLVRGNAGPRAGDRLRRGTILIEGDAGPYAGSRMIAGTLVVGGEAGALPGYLMNRGAIALRRPPAALAPSFADCGLHDLVAARLIGAFVREASPALAAIFDGTLRRYAGDLAALGKGEILVAGTR